MCFTVTLSERWRRVFGLCTTVLNIALVLMSLSLIIAGIAIRVKLDARLELLEDYDPGALPILLMVTSGLLFLTHLLATKFCYDATYLETRSTHHHRFIALIIFMVILCVYVFICEIVTLVHSSKIEDALERGISNLMQVYISDLKSKGRIDRLQLEFTCCGVHSYEDWFKIPWVNLAYVNTKHPDVQAFITDGKFIKDDAPFSCCDRYSKFACVHHSVKSSISHQSQQLTLSRQGCASAMSSYFHSQLIAPTAILILFILIFQVVAISLMRLLQTSIVSAEELGDPEADGAAYCIQTMGTGKDNRSYFEAKERKERRGTTGGDDDDDEDASDDEDMPRSGKLSMFGKMKTKLNKGKFPWKRKKKDDDDSDDSDDSDNGKKKTKKGKGNKKDKKKKSREKKDRGKNDKDKKEKKSWKDKFKQKKKDKEEKKKRKEAKKAAKAAKKDKKKDKKKFKIKKPKLKKSKTGKKK